MSRHAKFVIRSKNGRSKFPKTSFKITKINNSYRIHAWIDNSSRYWPLLITLKEDIYIHEHASKHRPKGKTLSKRRWPYPRGPLTRSKEARERERDEGWRREFGLRSDGRGGWSALAAGGVGKDSFTYIGAVAHCRDKASVGDVKCCQKQRTPSRDTNGNQKWSWRKTRADAAQKGDELFSLSRRAPTIFEFPGKKFSIRDLLTSSQGISSFRNFSMDRR